MRRIRVLPRQLADQIAAGEVVERPASVVKELVENSLDAGAARIEVEVEQGGVRVIRVRDDGHGMSRDELTLSLARHATSKIATFDDLHRVTSLGFRGEALPSIASVSRLELASAMSGEEQGWCLRVAGGEVTGPPAPVPHAPGTTVAVRDLFYNTPARRKFLRTERTEHRHIDDVLRRAALARFTTAFSLTLNARQVFSVAAAGGEVARTRRIARLVGGEFVARALAIDFEAAGLRLWGWIGAAGYSRASADLQHFIVNGRVVLDPMLRHGVRRACHELVPAGRHPAYVLYLELDPEEVDVNVHPTKHEVRFREARSVHDFLVRSLGNALRGPLGLLDAPLPPPANDAPPGVPPSPVHGEEPADGSAAPRPTRRPRADASFYRTLAGAGTASLGAADAPDGARPLGEALARVAGRFLLARAGDALVLVDTAAACRALARRRMLAAFTSGDAPARPLLVPLGVQVGEAGADALERIAALLARLGFDLRRVAPGTMSCRQVPVPLAGELPGEALHALARRASELDAGDDARDDVETARALVDAVLSRCDPSASRHWDADAMNSLLRELETLDDDAAAGERAPWIRIGADDLSALISRGGVA